jgi:hypothetical protein
MLSMIQQVNRERPNQYPIVPQPAWPPSWGLRDQKVRRWNKEEKISALCVGRLDTLRENVQNGKECKETVPLMTFDEW